MLDENQNKQYRHEIIWLEKEIEKLAGKVIKKPRVQRQINNYRRQIQQTEYNISLGL